jgi:hypothetical protein
VFQGDGAQATGSTLRRAQAALSKEEARALARNVLRQALNGKSAANRLPDMCVAAPMCEYSDLKELLFGHDDRATGLVALTHKDCKEEYAQLLGNCARFESGTLVLRDLGRAPTGEELASLSATKLLTVMHKMRWDMLEPLISSHGTALRAKMLSVIVDNPQLVAEAFIDHPKRVKPNADVEVASKWDEYSKLRVVHDAAVAVRESTRSIDPDVAFVRAMCHLSKYPAHMLPVLEMVPDEVNEAFDCYDVSYLR